jgi:hypothetical protein
MIVRYSLILALVLPLFSGGQALADNSSLLADGRTVTFFHDEYRISFSDLFTLLGSNTDDKSKQLLNAPQFLNLPPRDGAKMGFDITNLGHDTEKVEGKIADGQLALTNGAKLSVGGKSTLEILKELKLLYQKLYQANIADTQNPLK